MERRRDRDPAILRVCAPSRRKPEPAEAALNATPNPTHAGDSELLERIVRSTGDAPAQTKLRTDERVLARVTDGIYRQPGSAIRELLSNAYDADATRVVIRTDRPRFQTITVEDDGRGMSPETVVHVADVHARLADAVVRTRVARTERPAVVIELIGERPLAGPPADAWDEAAGHIAQHCAAYGYERGDGAQTVHVQFERGAFRDSSARLEAVIRELESFDAVRRTPSRSSPEISIDL